MDELEFEIEKWKTRLDEKFRMFIGYYESDELKETARRFFELGKKLNNNHQNNTIMSKLSGMEWGKKAYIVLSIAVVVVIWAVFFVSLFFGRLSHGPVEANWLEEVMKWVVMTPILVIIVDVVAYALIATTASRKAEGLDEKKDKTKK